MLSIRTVLCPVDLSAATARQVDLALDICRAFGARLILHHNRIELAIGSGVGWMWEPGHTAPAQTPEQKLQELMARVPDGTDAEMRLTRGPVVNAVETVSRAVAADLVVLNTRGAGRDRDDSVTDRLLESASLPIFAMHDALDEHRTPKFDGASGPPQPLLVPTDLTPMSQPATDVAFDLSRRFAFDIHLLHVLPRGAVDGEAADDARRRMTTLVPAGLPRRVEQHVDTGIPARVIARVAEQVSATCIVMGEHARKPLRHWFRPDTSRAVLHPAGCPIWYVPDRAPGVVVTSPTGNPTGHLVDELQETHFHYWPSSHLYGVVDSREDAELALAEILAAGIPKDRLHTWYGPSGTTAIDSTGQSHGRAARFWRMLEKATPERDLLDRYASEVENGHVCIGVYGGSREGIRVLTEILKKHGGHLISYFSVASVEHLS